MTSLTSYINFIVICCRYHIYCVGLRRVPSGRWHCKECAVCGSCGTQEPAGNSPDTPNAQWQHEVTDCWAFICYEDGQLRKCIKYKYISKMSVQSIKILLFVKYLLYLLRYILLIWGSENSQEKVLKGWVFELYLLKWNKLQCAGLQFMSANWPLLYECQLKWITLCCSINLQVCIWLMR